MSYYARWLSMRIALCNGWTICRHQFNIWYAHVWTQSIRAWRINQCVSFQVIQRENQSEVVKGDLFCVCSICWKHDDKDETYDQSIVLVVLITADQRFVCHWEPNSGPPCGPMESFSLYQLRYLETSSPTNLVVGCETWLLLSWIQSSLRADPVRLSTCIHLVFQSHSRTSVV